MAGERNKTAGGREASGMKPHLVVDPNNHKGI